MQHGHWRSSANFYLMFPIFVGIISLIGLFQPRDLSLFWFSISLLGLAYSAITIWQRYPTRNYMAYEVGRASHPVENHKKEVQEWIKQALEALPVDYKTESSKDVPIFSLAEVDLHIFVEVIVAVRLRVIVILIGPVNAQTRPWLNKIRPALTETVRANQEK